MDMWQVGKETIGTKIRRLFETGQWSDCRFLVGGSSNEEILEAHKVILAMSSPIFATMFFRDSSDGKNDFIPVPEIQPTTFKTLLKFIYTDSLIIDSIEAALELYYCGKKYLLPDIVTKCIHYLNSKLSSEQAIKVYEFAKAYEETDLSDRCLRLMCSQTQEILTHYNWKNAARATVSIIFQQDALNIDSENDLYKALLVWSEAECKRKSLPNDREILRIISADLITEIRFLALTLEKFTNGAGIAEILSEDEIFAINMNILSTESEVPMPEGFSDNRIPRCRPRRWNLEVFGQKLQKRYCHRVFASILHVENANSNLESSLAFEVDTNVKIDGIQISAQLPLRVGGQSYYHESFHASLLDSDRKTLTERHFSGIVHRNSIMPISFDNSIDIISHKTYRISVKFNQTGTYPAVSGCSEKVICDQVLFSFNVEPSEHNIHDGLIRAILFSK